MNAGPEDSAYTPKTFGQILDRILRLMRAHWKVLIGISAAPPLVLLVSLGLFFGAVMFPTLARMPKNMSPAEESHFAVTLFCTAIPALLLYVAAFGPSVAAACDAAVHADCGLALTLREAYARVCRRYWRLVWLYVLICLITGGPVLLVELILAGAFAMLHRAGIQDPALFALIPIGMLMIVGCLAYSIFTALRLLLAFPAVMTEDLTAREAIRRSRDLSRGSLGRICLVLIIVYAIAYVAYLIGVSAVGLLLGVGALFASAIHLPGAMQVTIIGCIAIGFAAMMIFYMSLSGAGFAAALGVLYNDQRMRTGGVERV